MRAVVAALLVLACLPLAVSLSAPPGAASHNGYAECPYSDQLTVVDGAIVAGEYADTYTDPDTGITVSLQYSGSTMAIGLQSPGQGWVAIAFSSVVVGTNYTNVIAAYVDALTGQVRAEDEVDHGWERHWDTSIGGTNDILAVAGVKNGTGTTVEFHYPLNSTDRNDQHFEPGGTYSFAVAFSASSSDFNSSDSGHSRLLLVYIGPTPSFLPPEGTRIAAGVPSRIVAGESTVLTAVLRNATGVGLSGRPLTFWLDTTFGPLLLGNATTNNAGKAATVYAPRGAGTWTLTVRFAGQGRFQPSEASAVVDVQDPVTSPPPILRTDTGIALIVLAVVGSIWLTYGFVAYQLSAIRAEGRGHSPLLAGLPRLRSYKAKGGEKHG